PGFDRRDLAVGHRQELSVALVHVVGEPAAIALGRQVERALDAILLDLDDDLLTPQFHAARLYRQGSRRRRALACGLVASQPKPIDIAVFATPENHSEARLPGL